MLDLKIGRVLNVDYKNNKVYVSSESAGGSIPLDLDSSISVQEMPDTGDLILWVLDEYSRSKIIKIWQNKKDLLRGGEGSLLPGEVQYQSAGGAFLHLNKKGDISLVDGSMRNIFKMIKSTLQSILKSTEIILQTYSGIIVTLKKDRSCEITNTDPITGMQKAKISIDKDGNVSIDATNLSLKNGELDFKVIDKIRLGGSAKVVISNTDGPIASVSQLRVSNKITGD